MKKIIIVIILILTGVLIVVGLKTAKTFLSGAASGCDPTGVRAQADSGSATVSWQTEKECQGVVEYGTTPASLLLRALETQPTTVHRVTLAPLKENTTYYFRIRVGEEIYDNNGIPYSFKTTAKEEGEEEKPKPTPTKTEAKPTTKPTTASCTKIKVCEIKDFSQKFGTTDCRYDLDENGNVNGADWALCLKQNK